MKLLDPDAQLRTHRSVPATGYELYSSEYSVVPPWSCKPINTGIATAFPSGLYARLAPHTGLALKNIDIGSSIIDDNF